MVSTSLMTSGQEMVQIYSYNPGACTVQVFDRHTVKKWLMVTTDHQIKYIFSIFLKAGWMTNYLQSCWLTEGYANNCKETTYTSASTSTSTINCSTSTYQTNCFHILQVYQINTQYLAQLLNTASVRTHLPSVLWHCWLGDWKGIQPVKKLGVGLLVVIFDWNFARLIAQVVTTTSITLSSNKIQNGDILVPANPCPPGKWPLTHRVREYVKCSINMST